MLPKKNRLTKKVDFERAMREGSLAQGRLFGLLVYKEQGQGDPRIGFIVSNKISKKATQRNRAKRLLREAVTSRLSEIPNQTVLVFLARKTILGKSKKEVEKEVARVLDKLV